MSAVLPGDLLEHPALTTPIGPLALLAVILLVVLPLVVTPPVGLVEDAQVVAEAAGEAAAVAATVGAPVEAVLLRLPTGSPWRRQSS